VQQPKRNELLVFSAPVHICFLALRCINWWYDIKDALMRYERKIWRGIYLRLFTLATGPKQILADIDKTLVVGAARDRKRVFLLFDRTVMLMEKKLYASLFTVL
jgi:hypothetical protein